MSNILTFIDLGIVLAGWRGTSNLRIKSLTILSEVKREFISSPFVRLEIKPKAVYHKNSVEVEFYETFFDNVSIWINDVADVVEKAEIIAEKYGLNGMDALHISAAIIAKADEFVTTERPTLPLHRVTEVKVVSIN